MSASTHKVEDGSEALLILHTRKDLVARIIEHIAEALPAEEESAPPQTHRTLRLPDARTLR